ncbi:MAG: hypothetical protein K0S47_2665 [Herbinix sp.]|jgi:hypothetical protein|nr:hypothetical protein [Herbinix sp.]
MLKVLKWEFIRRLKDIAAFLIFLLGAILLSIVVPSGQGEFSQFIAMVSSVLGGLIFVVSGIYLVVVTTSDLRKSSNVLDKSVAKSPWEIIGAKILNNFIYLSLIYGAVQLLSVILKRFATENTSYLIIEIEPVAILVIGIILPLSILFLYLFSVSILHIKKLPILSTVILLILMSELISKVTDLPLFHMEITGRICLIVFYVIFTLLLYIGACLIYEKYYEV